MVSVKWFLSQLHECRGLTSLAVQVKKIEDTGTAAHGVVVGDTRRARANISGTFDDLRSRRGNGQRGESDNLGELHLERSVVRYCILILAEACDGDDERKFYQIVDEGLYLCFGQSAQLRASPTSVCFVL